MTDSLQYPVLVIDDEDDILSLMEMTLMKMGLRVHTASGVTEAKAKLDSQRYSLVLTDMRMPDGSGLEVVQHINQRSLDTPVAVITAFGNADQAQEALRTGAFDYIQKPITLAQLRSLVKSAVSVSESQHKAPAAAHTPMPSETPAAPVDHPHTDIPADTHPYTEPDIPRLLGRSPQMTEVRHLIRRLAPSNVPVYISGESGTGKEQAARTIHELSDRAGKPFVAVNCGAIPENLMESEFFGYRKGSFTGADKDHSGFFRHADGGTLFLDEVADLPLSMQVKLLRAIQEKAVRRIGDSTEQPVDVRIICATHKNLEALVESGAFRQDLYYRLNVITLCMPPLREMREDLGQLIPYLLHKYRHGDQTYSLTPKAREMLLHYSYPGNFRELENILERAIALSVGHIIQIDDLQIQDTRHKTADHTGGSGEPVNTFHTDAHNGSLPPFNPETMQIQDYLDQIERNIIEQVLEQTQHNRTQAAKVLGISFRSMRYRMERLNIN